MPTRRRITARRPARRRNPMTRSEILTALDYRSKEIFEHALILESLMTSAYSLAKTDADLKKLHDAVGLLVEGMGRIISAKQKFGSAHLVPA